MELIKLKLLDTDGMTLLTAPAAGQVSLVYMNAYKPGDRVSLEIGTPGQYVVIQFEDTMAPALVYVVKREINFHIPFGEQAITYSPKSFAGACHIIRARFATPEEIAADATREGVELYYWPSEVPGSKFVVVMSGNVLNNTANMSEGYATAWRLHQMGYAAFVLRYRVFLKAKDNAPVADLGNAVRFITTHAGQFNVQPENYALLGYSSGGHLAGVFSGDELGYKHYGVPKPGALLLGYPINNFFEYKPVYHAAIDPFVLEGRYYELNISDCVTDDYPPVYHWYGENDYVFPLLCYPAQRPALSRALEKHHVPCKEVLFPNATHGVGTGAGTDADGWMLDAANFWETQING